MKKISVLILFLLAPALGTNVEAQEYEELEGIYYDDLIQELTVKESYAPNRNVLDEVMIHTGLSFVNSIFTLNSPGGQSIYTSTRGMQFTLGIDLLSPSWLAEGVIKSYGDTREDEGTISASEFDLRFAYVNPVNELLKMRFGAGIGARYLNVKWKNEGRREYQSPVSILMTGVDFYLSKNVSLGADASARTPMTDETPDQTAIEIALKVDGHF